MSDSESDIEIRSALPKLKNKKTPKSPTEDTKTKKITTKMMIVDALVDLNTRKGVSLYAIKKHLTEKYEVDTNKVNYLIKKTIKAGVEDGTFVQMKGIGAAGSFKLANKEKPKTKKKPAKPKESKEKTKEKPTTSPEKKTKKLEKKTTKETKTDDERKEARKPKKMDIKKTEKTDEKKDKKEKKEKKEKKVIKAPEKEEKQEGEEKKKKKVKIAKGISTPSKKRSAMMKRKSIGSIIKPPKMKPKKT